MGNSTSTAQTASTTASTVAAAAENANKSQSCNVPKDGKKPSPCCVCKETKQKRDECIIINGEENCTALIEAHKACMKTYGFDI